MCNAAFSQVPFFAGTAGNGNLYGYTSLKICTGHNAQETYSCLQYGIGDQIAVGADISANGDKAYWGTIVRWGKQICPYFGIGAQVTPALDLTDNLKYGHTTAALFLNGNITTNGKLFWCSNTWWGINNGGKRMGGYIEDASFCGFDRPEINTQELAGYANTGTGDNPIFFQAYYATVLDEVQMQKKLDFIRRQAIDMESLVPTALSHVIYAFNGWLRLGSFARWLTPDVDI